ncbi:hypothetical protein Hamer_G028616 [Homarus americanus]|uniref:Uncharacterized protein n=1 Tax=Homarus americanus TaxID=6706 RepID=A0A8J5K8C4_HOMAM|nr:hypothetical protein Hamer_G028616 [Homarus americanus]
MKFPRKTERGAIHLRSRVVPPAGVRRSARLANKGPFWFLKDLMSCGPCVRRWCWELEDLPDNTFRLYIDPAPQTCDFPVCDIDTIPVCLTESQHVSTTINEEPCQFLVDSGVGMVDLNHESALSVGVLGRQCRWRRQPVYESGLKYQKMRVGRANNVEI